MRMIDVIAAKRDGHVLTREQMQYFVDGYVAGSIPDYQASALLMAIYLKGMSHQETAELTDIMAKSGDMVDLSGIEGIKVDKHSTGGVGDKTTLILAPIVAACGANLAKMSGRGLGHTGGTLDKLEAIPGFRINLSPEEFIESVNRVGCAVVGQTGNIAPADKKIYALRDVTATVGSIPLIASSIMSKKLASGADKLVLDVKVGSGALMKTLAEARELAELMVQIGERNGRETIALLTDMDTPLGNNIGNLLEVREAWATLNGHGPADLTQICLILSAHMLRLAGKGTYDECFTSAKAAISTGVAAAKFLEMIRNQGGDPSVLLSTDETSSPSTAVSSPSSAVSSHPVYATESGWITSMDTEALGISSMLLGAGRQTKDDVIDYQAGIILNLKTGMQVSEGDLLGTLITTDPTKFSEAETVFRSAYHLGSAEPAPTPLILEQIDKNGIKKF